MWVFTLLPYFQSYSVTLKEIYDNQKDSFGENRISLVSRVSLLSLWIDSLLRLQSHNYEERYRMVEGELRKLVAMRGTCNP